MAQVLWINGRAYSDFRHGGRRVRRALRLNGEPARNKRDAAIALGEFIRRMRVGDAGQQHDRYPWEELKRRLIENNERRKQVNGLRRDGVALKHLEQFYAEEYGRPLECVADVTREVLERFMAMRRTERMQPSTIKREAGSLKAAMRWAEACQPPLRPIEDWRRVKLPKVGKRRPPHHSRRDLARLLEMVPPGRYLHAFWLGARAGLRRGEILHTRPEDISLERRAVAVVGKDCDLCAECRDRGNRWEPKDVDERDVPMPADLCDYFARALPHLRGRPWVMADAKGRRPDLNEFSATVTKLTRKAGLKGGPQKLRATWVTHALQDVPSKIVQQWAGHGNLSTTEQYASPGDQDAAYVERMRPVTDTSATGRDRA